MTIRKLLRWLRAWWTRPQTLVEPPNLEDLTRVVFRHRQRIVGYRATEGDIVQVVCRVRKEAEGKQLESSELIDLLCQEVEMIENMKLSRI